MNLKEQIESDMVKKFHDLDIILSFTDTFESLGYDIDAIIDAWQSLANEGKLTIIASVHCERGHQVWESPLSGLDGCIKQCLRCHHEEEQKFWTSYHAEMTSKWKSELLVLKVGGSADSSCM